MKINITVLLLGIKYCTYESNSEASLFCPPPTVDRNAKATLFFPPPIVDVTPKAAL